MSNPDYLTVRQVADRFGKSPSWVVRRIKDGRLPASNINTPEFPRYAIRNEDVNKLIVASTRRVEVVTGDVIEFIK
jgi:hypothetical protein